MPSSPPSSTSSLSAGIWVSFSSASIFTLDFAILLVLEAHQRTSDVERHVTGAHNHHIVGSHVGHRPAAGFVVGGCGQERHGHLHILVIDAGDIQPARMRIAGSDETSRRTSFAGRRTCTSLPTSVFVWIFTPSFSINAMSWVVTSSGRRYLGAP